MMAQVKRNLTTTLFVVLLALGGVGFVLSAIFGASDSDKKAAIDLKQTKEQLGNASGTDAKQYAAKFDSAVAAAKSDEARKIAEKATAAESEAREKAAKALADAKNGKGAPGAGYPPGSPNAGINTASTGGAVSNMTPAQQTELALRIERDKELSAVRGSKIAAWEDGGGVSAMQASLGMGAAGGVAGVAGLPSAEALARMAGNGQGSVADSDGRAAARAAILAAGQTQAPASVDARNAAFVKEAGAAAGRNERDKATANSLPQRPLSKHTVYQGWRIPAVLITDINSDLPGDLQAMVTETVYDSITGTQTLIPQGSRLAGVYNSEVVTGQERLVFAFQRLIYPNGVSVELGSMPGSDRFGAAGMAGDVNTRFWSIFGSSLLVGAVSTVATRNASNGGNVSINVGGALTQTASSILAETTKKMLERNINIKPTISLKKGEKFAISVAHDLILPPATTRNNGL